MKEFRSRLEDIIPAVLLKFPGTAGFKPFSRCFHPDSITHPAKANCYLLYYLIKKFTMEGDTVLDPMAGTSSTGIIGSLLGRNTICVDIEQKFVDLSRKNVSFLERSERKKGEVKVIQGDARKLSNLLKEADAVLTSPPYSGSVSGYLPKPEIRAERMRKAGHDPEQFLGGLARSAQIEDRYTDRKSKGNIGNLGHGRIDAVVTSPPYANSQTEVDGEKGRRGGDSKQRVKKDYAGVSEDNIGRFPDGEVDAVITSPPYAHDSVVHKNERRTKVAKEKFGYSQFYSTSEFNIGNLKIDTVITSPPYEETQPFHDTDFMIKTAEDRSRHYKDGLSKGHFASAEAIKRSNKKLVSEYSNDPSNIGNLKKETYLEAMLKVYAEMFKVLKHNGLAVIIIKPFIRDKKVVDLPLQTWLLLEKVGFRLIKLYKLRLKNPSFWRVLYRKNHPDVPMIGHEYVLVTRR